MEGSCSLGIMLVIVLLSCGMVSGVAFASGSSVIRVPQDYATIHEAVAAANPGDTVLVSAGIYEDYVRVDKSVKIIGEGAANTTIGSIGAVFDVYADNVTISDLFINCYEESSVALHDSNGCNISDNVMRTGLFTMTLINSSRNLITRNTIIPRGSGWGIFLYRSDNNIVSENLVKGAREGVGIYLFECRNNTVKDNQVMQNGCGIAVEYCGHNIMQNNIAKDNGVGIILSYCAGNWIYHNNLINNPVEVWYATGPNYWSNGVQGNYWSDYCGTDLNDDGIGDTFLPWQGVDWFPLMSPWRQVRGDLNDDGVVDIFDVVSAASVYGTTRNDPYWNPLIDLAAPWGLVNIFDLVTLISSYGSSWRDVS
jgi:parallel beta-helix repeat protein